MTTYIPFAPSPNAIPPFQTIVTLDGKQYSLICVWNVYRQDWYYTISDQAGNVVITQPLIASPTTSDIYLAPGIFTTSTLLYRITTGNLEINP
ncbi:MAG: hypothetical protein KGL35_12075 [Bradyrhizobium sp.]|nr:hypothetical protein [Bradyrhizobium sp.]